MRKKAKIALLCWITLVCLHLRPTFADEKSSLAGDGKRTKRDNGVINNNESSGDGIVASKANANRDLLKTIKLEHHWFPRLNVSCERKELKLRSNPSCVDGKLQQTRKVCPKSAFKNPQSAGRRCVTSQRLINCTVDQVCSEWSWQRLTNCCKSDSCEYEGMAYKKHECIFHLSRKCRRDIHRSCTVSRIADHCTCGRASSSESDFENWTNDDGGKGVPIRTVAIGLAGTVMVGLLVFAALRIRKAARERRNQPVYNREVQGVDNQALGPMPSDSRIQTILNTINANGRNYELRERSDSVPGRRVYVLSPTSPQDNHVAQPRGRGFSRTLSQLSSIAEESTEDALSHITEATEPPDGDCVFRYDSDAINEVEKISSPTSECAFKENLRPASSSEAINSLNDVIAMYDADNDEDNNNIMKENSRLSAADFRVSSGGDDNDYLKSFGWKPQERAWKLEKLKDSNSKSNEKLSASCSTLDSRYSENSVASTASFGNDGVTENGFATDEDNSLDPLLGNGGVISPSFKDSRLHKSMPSVLDTSQIPDIDVMLADDLEKLDRCDVTKNDVQA